jgi:FAD/FMN-containing dehydrogenase
MKFTSFSKSHVQESDLGYYDTDIPTNRDWIPRGNGNSYSNSAQIDNGLVIKSSGSKIFRISPDLSNVICSSNVTIGELLLYLAKYNREIEILPGSSNVTLGGSLAFDVHGKNHSIRGSFINQVDSFEIKLATGDLLNCSRDFNSDLFVSTIGGMGLTGFISTITLRTVLSKGHYVTVKKLKTLDLADSCNRLINSVDEYSIAWIDLVNKNASGRGILTSFNRDPDLNFNLSRKFKPTLPSVMPNLINKSSISLFNNMLYQSSKPSSINHLYKELFPLDSVRNWFSVFGKFGLAEFQFTFKLENIQDVHKLILHYRKENIPALVAIKKFGASSSGLLSFPEPELCLGITSHFNPETTVKFSNYLSSLVTDFGGRVYLSKNTYPRLKDMKRQYPNFDKFLTIKEKYDPKMTITSDLFRSIFD